MAMYDMVKTEPTADQVKKPWPITIQLAMLASGVSLVGMIIVAGWLIRLLLSDPPQIYFSCLVGIVTLVVLVSIIVPVGFLLERRRRARLAYTVVVGAWVVLFTVAWRLANPNLLMPWTLFSWLKWLLTSVWMGLQTQCLIISAILVWVPASKRFFCRPAPSADPVIVASPRVPRASLFPATRQASPVR